MPFYNPKVTRLQCTDYLIVAKATLLAFHYTKVLNYFELFEISKNNFIILNKHTPILIYVIVCQSFKSFLIYT